jgi:basic membrane protein A
MKGLQASVYDLVKAFYDGNFPGGQNRVFTAENNGVGLPMGTSKFNTFSQADYDAIYAKLASNSVTIVNDAGSVNGAPSSVSMPLSIVKVTEI